MQLSGEKLPPPARSGDGAEDMQLPKWQYFKSLLLLKDFVTPRITKGPLKLLLANNSAYAVSSQDVIEEESQVSLHDEDNNTFTLPETEGRLVTQGESDRQLFTPKPIRSREGGKESGTLSMIINGVSCK